MANIPPTLAREEAPELGNETLEESSSDTDAADSSMNSSPPEDDSMQHGKESLKTSVYRSDKGFPFMEDGLPD